MSYMMSIDEVSDEALIQELERRQTARAHGKCAYCGWKSDHSDYPGRNDPGYGGICLRGNLVGTKSVLTLDMLRAVNGSRAERWYSGPDVEAWSGADWSNAMQGEAGEAGNVVKKIRRHETGFGKSANTPPDIDMLLYKLGRELADTIIYADLLAKHYGLDLTEHVKEKFNHVSVINGFPERL